MEGDTLTVVPILSIGAIQRALRTGKSAFGVRALDDTGTAFVADVPVLRRTPETARSPW